MPATLPHRRELPGGEQLVGEQLRHVEVRQCGACRGGRRPRRSRPGGARRARTRVVGRPLQGKRGQLGHQVEVGVAERDPEVEQVDGVGRRADRGRRGRPGRSTPGSSTSGPNCSPPTASAGRESEGQIRLARGQRPVHGGVDLGAEAAWRWQRLPGCRRGGRGRAPARRGRRSRRRAGGVPRPAVPGSVRASTNSRSDSSSRKRRGAVAGAVGETSERSSSRRTTRPAPGRVTCSASARSKVRGSAARRQSTHCSSSSRRSQVQSNAVSSVRCRLDGPARSSGPKPWSSCSASSATVRCRTRAAASSMARGRPSSRRQMRPTSSPVGAGEVRCRTCSRRGRGRAARAGLVVAVDRQRRAARSSDSPGPPTGEREVASTRSVRRQGQQRADQVGHVGGHPVAVVEHEQVGLCLQRDTAGGDAGRRPRRRRGRCPWRPRRDIARRGRAPGRRRREPRRRRPRARAPAASCRSPRPRRRSPSVTARAAARTAARSSSRPTNEFCGHRDRRAPRCSRAAVTSPARLSTPQLAAQGGDVALDGSHRDVELFGDLGVAQPALDRSQHRRLARRQVFPGEPGHPLTIGPDLRVTHGCARGSVGRAC